MAKEDNLSPFKEGESGNPNGRPKKLQTLIQEHFLGEHNFRLSPSQTNELIESFLSKPMNELIELAKNDTLPFWIAMLVKKATTDYKKGSMELIEKLWDRVHGKPKQLPENQPTTQPIIINISTDDSDPTN